jgi:hypothetical protein
MILLEYCCVGFKQQSLTQSKLAKRFGKITGRHYPDSESTSLCSLSLMLLVSGEATNTNFIFFGLTRPGLKPTTYRTHANHYATDAVIQIGI